MSSRSAAMSSRTLRPLTNSSRRPQQPKRRPQRMAFQVPNGHMERISSNPPPLTLSPWNKATLVMKANGEKTVKVSDIATTFADQLDPSKHGLLRADKRDSGLRVQLKFQSLRVYAPSALSVGLSVEDFNDNFNTKGGRDQLAGVMDIGTSAHPPALRYAYPLSHRQQVIRTDDLWWDVPIFDIAVATGVAWLAYIELLWMFDGPIKFSSHAVGMTEILSAVEENTAAIRASQPSVAERVIQGATVAATYVVPMAGSSFDDRLQILEEKFSKFDLDISASSSTIN